MGFPDLRMIVIPHPLGGIPPEEVLAKVPAAADAVGERFGVS